jgi:hypothetical protein
MGPKALISISFNKIINPLFLCFFYVTRLMCTSLDRFVIPANSFGARELYILSFLGANTAAGGGVGIEYQNPSLWNEEILLGGVDDKSDFTEEVEEREGGADRGVGDDRGRLDDGRSEA